MEQPFFKCFLIASAMVGALFVLSLAAGCSGTAVCEEDGDCFADEYCHRGRCLLAEPDDAGNGDEDVVDQDGEGDQDGGDDGDAGNGSDSGGDNDEQSTCMGSVPCSSGVDELDSGDAVIFRPDDSESNLDRYGCNIGSGSEVFIGGDVEPVEAQTCPAQEHAYRIPVFTCVNYDFILELTLTPLDEHCPIEEWFDEVKFAVSSTPIECDPGAGITTHCFNFFEEDGVYRWVAVFAQVSDPGQRKERWPGLDLKPVTGSSVPYEVAVSVEATSGPE